ncbi:MAG: L-serine ammonia-lyase, iron-sulfur-dependent, subunit alpha [Lachnospiraceae bacterium]|jgi:L-cysteine desulfidase|nr:L-serine ammonia-lyase, iron-sulfur-dependent, subunit alpha [Lachnospiraceae bacterium]MCI1726301.1 L-serine ammonia-lyase, iron-sulfur-dependent, subunit alpha [Lachnospiraceae bacterium]
MKKTDRIYQDYLNILKEELIPATGCTEPIAIAYVAAKAKEVLGELPQSCEIEVSGNIIKNVKSVIVPNTGGLRGIESAVAAGVTVGRADLLLEVLSEVRPEDTGKISAFAKQHPVKIIPSGQPAVFYIAVTLRSAGHEACVIVEDYHTNITKILKDGRILFSKECKSSDAPGNESGCRSALTVRDITDFADSADPEDLRPLVGRQIERNMAIAEEGIRGNWGAGVGKVLLDTCGEDVRVRARAMAAAGSDARMSGCEMQVIIVAGSGNQGITASVPVAVYGKETGAEEGLIYRAVALSDLVTLEQKERIGRLSAFCGTVCAGSGAGAGIAYLCGGGYKGVAHTIVNALAVVSGMVCDGAKPSCAAKIASSVDAGIMGWEMYRHGRQFFSGDGIVTKGVDNTIRNVGRMAKEGMRETDREILDIMVGKK